MSASVQFGETAMKLARTHLDAVWSLLRVSRETSVGDRGGCVQMVCEGYCMLALLTSERPVPPVASRAPQAAARSPPQQSEGKRKRSLSHYTSNAVPPQPRFQATHMGIRTKPSWSGIRASLPFWPEPACCWSGREGAGRPSGGGCSRLPRCQPSHCTAHSGPAQD